MHEHDYALFTPDLRSSYALTPVHCPAPYIQFTPANNAIPNTCTKPYQTHTYTFGSNHEHNTAATKNDKISLHWNMTWKTRFRSATNEMQTYTTICTAHKYKKKTRTLLCGDSNEAEMHRVLSYQAAMQINEDRDIRAYITKRTCVSVIFSASFFTLIMGEFTHFSNFFIDLL